MTDRPNALNRREVAEALRSFTLFDTLRDYFGPTEESHFAGETEAFECVMEFEPDLARIELYLFAGADNGTPALVHLIAWSGCDGKVAPSVVELEGLSYNARHLSADAFSRLLRFIGSARDCQGRACSDALQGYQAIMKPMLLAELRAPRFQEADRRPALFHWGDLAQTAAI